MFTVPDRRITKVPEDASDLAGFEVWRWKVWASPLVRALDARFFPRLDGADLWVEPEDLDAFGAECALLRRWLDLIAEASGVRAEDVGLRLAHIEAAVERARGIGGGVVVW
ncbi:hypothetical protein Afil01_38770 [Actinorhabdospora filicis]|uniref:Uncharacterized protein n=1 Tax=Actinorhabdospora filicis TaxID=1785913 RepID=A0A9W6WBU3_9ACTN|nr:hypothetical protein Afil01_38770 [Actinorhabdospora filicis]